ncbi:MAG: DUF1080 domain-containing protein [Phycisphaeraceae bacterium]|nr:DUF1080 domain-containing protein [Phycisphaeraceae bacterium]MBX3367759.1 DUF1080 domain-containing protein [Phycisphaeraceae bacterium]
MQVSIVRHAALALVIWSSSAAADIGMPAIFGDGMVLQRDTQVPVWGWASPGERVRVTGSWAPDKSEDVVADARGQWVVKLSTPESVAGPSTLTVQGTTTKVFKDVLIGEVWVCSGQSNMEWPLAATEGAQAEIARASDPMVRLFTVKNTISLHPRIDCEGEWTTCTPENAAKFSAVGYYFAREIASHLNVPVGIISADWGGTPAQAWSSEPTLAKFPEFASQLDFVAKARDPQTRDAVTEGWERRWWDGLDQPGAKRQPREWITDTFDDSAWSTMEVPGVFAGDELGRHDGIVYFRRTIDLTPEFAGAGGGGAGRLHLGPIDDRDTVWLNGKQIGATHSDGKWAEPREYEIPAGLLRSGRNVVAVRVLDTGGLGAIGTASGRAHEVKLIAGVGPSEQSVSIAGSWRYAIGPSMRELPPMTSAPQIGPGTPTSLYNGMIAPIVPFAIRGVIWYQGESNIGNAPLYARLFPAMIEGWRNAWGQGEFPFYFVQIAPYRYPNVNPHLVAELRESQQKSLVTSNTVMAVTLDIGNPADIHPANKRDVGLRLASIALANTYGQDGIEWSGPIPSGVNARGPELRITFDHADGMELRQSAVPQIWIAGEDRKFRPAGARVEGDALVLTHPSVPAPVAVRYAWASSPEAVIFGSAGLPAAPFRTDSWSASEVEYVDDGRTVHLTTEPGFTPLFNGKDLSGWFNINCAPSTWQVRDGMIICSGFPTGLLRTDRHYENFIMEVEFRHMRAGGNAGIFVWSDPMPAKGQPFTRSVEVQVMDGLEGDWYTSDGDIFPIWGATMVPENGRGGTRAFPTEKRMLPSPGWNHYRIECVNGEISLAVNGKVVTRGREASPRKGYICLESEGSEVHFRNLLIKELPPSAAPLSDTHIAKLDEGFTSLYNGVDLSGWRANPANNGHWRANDYVLSYDGKGDHLWTEQDFRDFVLIADWRWTGPAREVDRPVIDSDGTQRIDSEGRPVTAQVKEAGDSGIYLRGNEKSQVNIWCWPVGSGEVYGYRTDMSMPPAVRAAVTPRENADAPLGEWNRFVITMKGERLTVQLNGKTVIEDAHLPGVPASGPIGLQHHGDPIEFSNIYVKPLN